MNIEELSKRVEQLEFREGLILENSEVSRILLEYNITRDEYRQIQDVMEDMRNKIENGISVSSVEYETAIQDIFGGFIVASHRTPAIEYHFCEFIAKAFWEDGCWKEVFQTLYGDNMKYKHLFENEN
nr:MAG TPA: Protein of unknown function (DUF1878) [Bacteriophage sp.]